MYRKSRRLPERPSWYRATASDIIPGDDVDTGIDIISNVLTVQPVSDGRKLRLTCSAMGRYASVIDVERDRQVRIRRGANQPNHVDEGAMKIRINERRFKQIVREEMMLAKLSKLREDVTSLPQPTGQTQQNVQAAGGQVRRKKQYTCRCGAKFMDYEGVKGTPICPKCNDAEVKATSQSQQGAAK